MALADRIDELNDYIGAHEDYLALNHTLFKVKEGELAPLIKADLKKSLSESYYEKIKNRIVPINVLRRILDKLSKVYANYPIREVTNGNTTDEELLQWYEGQLEMNSNGNSADEFANLFKGYAWEPFLSSEGEPRLRTLPYDRFLVFSDDMADATKETIFIKLMGDRFITVGDKKKKVKIRFAYSKDEFLPFTSDGEIYTPALEDNDGVNPFDVIPQMYGNRSQHSLVPPQDTDLLPMTKVIPVLLTDLSGQILFSVFSITWGIDVHSENLVMSPNAFWSLKSDKESDKQPQVGTLKPQADIQKVLDYVKNVFSFWLESRGIKVSSVGSIDGDNAPSGIAKIIDEIDTTEIRKVSMGHFQKEEKKLWQLIKVMHNYWVDKGMLKEPKPRFSNDFEVSITFDEPQPKIDRKTQVETVKLEVDSGFLDMSTAIEKLYPDLSIEQIVERKLAVANDRSVMAPLQGGTESSNVSHSHDGTGPDSELNDGTHDHSMLDGSGNTSADNYGAGHSHTTPDDGDDVGEPIENKV